MLLGTGEALFPVRDEGLLGRAGVRGGCDSLLPAAWVLAALEEDKHVVWI
jgi:hypothetical protein